MATLQNLVVRLGMDPTSLMKGASRAQKRVAMFRADVDKTSRSIRRMSDDLGSLSRPTGLIALTAAGALASKAIPAATTALLAVPAAGAIAGAAFATAATAAGGMSEAMEALADGDAEKIAEAMKNLSPAAQGMAKAMHGVRTSFGEVQKAVQESVFAGLDREVQALGSIYLPVLKTGMTGVGSALNGMAKAASGAVKSPFFQGVVADVFASTKTAIENLTPAVGPLFMALGNLVKVGLPLVEQFTAWLGKAAESKLAFLGSAEGLAWLQAKVDSSIASFQQLMDVVGPIVTALVGMGSAVGQLISWYSQLPPGVQSTVATMLLWGMVISNVVSRFAPLIAGISRVSGALLKSATTDGGLLKTLGSKFVQYASTVGSALGRAALAVGRYAVQAAIGLGRVAVAMAVHIAGLIAQGAVIVAQWVVMAAGAMARAVVMAAAWVVAMGPIGWVIAAVVALVALIIANWDTVKAWTISAWNAVVDWIVGVWDSIVSAVSSAVQWVVDLVSNAWNSIVSWVQNFAQRFVQLHVDAWNMVKNAFTNGANAVTNFVSSIPGRILGALGDLGGLLVGAGRAIMDGLRRGIEAAWNGVKSLLQSITNMIPDWKGPMRVDLKLLEPTGRAIMHGLSVGIDDGTEGLFRQLQGITTDIGGAVAPPKAATVNGAGESGLTPAAIRDAMSGMTLTFDRRGGEVLAKLVNDVNGNNNRR